MLFVFFHKFFHSSSGINQLLLSSEKWVACGTDFYFNLFINRTKLNRITTGAGCVDFMVGRVYIFFSFLITSNILFLINRKLILQRVCHYLPYQNIFIRQFKATGIAILVGHKTQVSQESDNIQYYIFFSTIH